MGVLFVDLLLLLPIVVLVPKSTLLSVRTTSLKSYIPPELIFSREATSGTLLTLILLHEFLLGKEGPWWGYLQSLPRNDGHWGVQLPLFLKKDSKEWNFISRLETGRMIKRAEAHLLERIEGLGMSLVSLHKEGFFARFAKKKESLTFSLDFMPFSRQKACLFSRKRTFHSFPRNQKKLKRNSFKII